MSNGPTETVIRGRCTGSPVAMHVASSGRSAVVRLLAADEGFAVDHSVGEGADRWLAIRTGSGETGYIPASAPIQVREAVVPARRDPSPPSDSSRWFGKAASDLCVGAGLIAAGGGALWYFGTTGLWPSTGGAKEWVAIGYGGFRLVRGLTNLGSSSA